MLQPPPFDIADHSDDGSRPPITVVNLILSEALSANATRIDLEVDAAQCIVKYEQSGSWIELLRVPSAIGLPLLNRLRVMSALDRVGGSRDQTGEIHAMFRGKEVILGLVLKGGDGASQGAVISIPSVAA